MNWKECDIDRIDLYRILVLRMIVAPKRCEHDEDSLIFLFSREGPHYQWQKCLDINLGCSKFTVAAVLCCFLLKYRLFYYLYR